MWISARASKNRGVYLLYRGKPATERFALISRLLIHILHTDHIVSPHFRRARAHCFSIPRARSSAPPPPFSSPVALREELSNEIPSRGRWKINLFPTWHPLRSLRGNSARHRGNGKGPRLAPKFRLYIAAWLCVCVCVRDLCLPCSLVFTALFLLFTSCNGVHVFTMLLFNRIWSLMNDIKFKVNSILYVILMYMIKLR